MSLSIAKFLPKLRGGTLLSWFCLVSALEKTIDKPIVLDYITKLMNNELFYKRLNGQFTLVMPFGNKFKNEIETIINDYDGSIVFDEKIVAKNLRPVLKAFDEIM